MTGVRTPGGLAGPARGCGVPQGWCVVVCLSQFIVFVFCHRVRLAIECDSIRIKCDSVEFSTDISHVWRHVLQKPRRRGVLCLARTFAWLLVRACLSATHHRPCAAGPHVWPLCATCPLRRAYHKDDRNPYILTQPLYSGRYATLSCEYRLLA